MATEEAKVLDPEKLEVRAVELDGGARYVGEVCISTGQRHGLGIYWLPDGSRYEGTWQENSRHGPGVVHLASGYRVEGTFSDDTFHGLAAIFSPRPRNPGVAGSEASDPPKYVETASGSVVRDGLPPAQVQPIIAAARRAAQSARKLVDSYKRKKSTNFRQPLQSAVPRKAQAKPWSESSGSHGNMHGPAVAKVLQPPQPPLLSNNQSSLRHRNPQHWQPPTAPSGNLPPTEKGSERAVSDDQNDHKAEKEEYRASEKMAKQDHGSMGSLFVASFARFFSVITFFVGASVLVILVAVENDKAICLLDFTIFGKVDDAMEISIDKIFGENSRQRGLWAEETIWPPPWLNIPWRRHEIIYERAEPSVQWDDTVQKQSDLELDNSPDPSLELAQDPDERKFINNGLYDSDLYPESDEEQAEYSISTNEEDVQAYEDAMLQSEVPANSENSDYASREEFSSEEEFDFIDVSVDQQYLDESPDQNLEFDDEFFHSNIAEDGYESVRIEYADHANDGQAHAEYFETQSGNRDSVSEASTADLSSEEAIQFDAIDPIDPSADEDLVDKVSTLEDITDSNSADSPSTEEFRIDGNTGTDEIIEEYDEGHGQFQLFHEERLSNEEEGLPDHELRPTAHAGSITRDEIIGGVNPANAESDSTPLHEHEDDKESMLSDSNSDYDVQLPAVELAVDELESRDGSLLEEAANGIDSSFDDSESKWTADKRLENDDRELDIQSTIGQPAFVEDEASRNGEPTVNFGENQSTENSHQYGELEIDDVVMVR